ncbi:hypothetical protein PMAYCL1PPCAC_16870, partial [Pristionchus mayeri]
MIQSRKNDPLGNDLQNVLMRRSIEEENRVFLCRALGDLYKIASTVAEQDGCSSREKSFIQLRNCEHESCGATTSCSKDTVINMFQIAYESDL